MRGCNYITNHSAWHPVAWCAKDSKQHRGGKGMGRMAMITAAADGWAVVQSASAGAIEVVLHSGGHSWRDHAMAGGAGSSAVAQPKSRVIPGNPPATARAQGPAIQEW